MAAVNLNVDQWAEEQFGRCALGDKRRTRRLVQYAAQVAANPNASTPRQTESWADCKAAYNLIECEDVTFQAIAQPHFEMTRARTTGTWLLLGDTTETHFPGNSVTGLGPTGDGGGRGFLLHSSLMVRPDGKEIVGLAGQVIRYRRSVKREPGGAQRLRRKDRESRIWSDLLTQIGPAPEGVQFIHVFDRGGDQFELYCRMSQQQAGWVVRAAQLHRWIFTPQGERRKLSDYLAALPVQGSYTLELTANKNQPARTANLEVRFGPVTMPRPKHVSDWVRKSGIKKIDMWVVEACETAPPEGVEAARWVLWSAHPVTCFEDAWRTLEHYEKRPLIEEYHKALKTGCSLEERQYETAARLEAITGVLSVAAVRLLQLKMVARDEPQRPAREVIPLSWIVMLQRLRQRKQKRKPEAAWTVRDFYHQLAMLGGFLGRKSDGSPGWITLWRGFEKLHLCLRGADAINKKCG
jgi:hypothetical protein